MGLKRNEKQFLFQLVMPLCAVLIVTTILFFAGYEGAAVTVGSLGSITVMFGVFFYIVLFDSKRRWPNTSVSERIARILSFER